jgi:hypothetical protein
MVPCDWNPQLHHACLRESLALHERTDALKFLIHFLAHVTQPLHVAFGLIEVEIKYRSGRPGTVPLKGKQERSSNNRE